MELDQLEADVRDLAQDIRDPREGIQHPWVLRSATFGRRAIWEIRSDNYAGAPYYSGTRLFEGAEFVSEEERLAASPRRWRDLVSGGCAFKEFLPHRKDGTGGPFASWEEAEGWLLAA